MTNKTQFIVVGSGLYGLTVGRILADQGYRVRIVERRQKIGGNAASTIDRRTGIELHDYGCHIFHTSNEDVWRFIQRFSDFNGYKHLAVAMSKGKAYLLPIGLSLLNKFFNVEMSPAQAERYMQARDRREKVFDAFFRGYTRKQWGTVDAIDSAIIKRIPVRYNYDTNYFYDIHQGIPLNGYQAMFERMVAHPNIEVELGVKWTLDMHEQGQNIIYSGPIDALFGYKYGALPWRSLRFESEAHDIKDFQGVGVVNYVDEDVPYTRIHEYKHYHPERRDILELPHTVICREYPMAWSVGNEPFYPVQTSASMGLYAKYKADVDKIPWLTVGGRLGSYKYINMDEAIKAGMEAAKAYAGS